MYKIKEEKLLRTQKRYYLALKLLDITGNSSQELPNGGKDSDGVIRVVSGDVKAQNGWMENRPKRLNRANLKLQAARVYHLINKPHITEDLLMTLIIFLIK